jgi:surface antigen
MSARLLRALIVVLAGTLLGGCFDLSVQLELRADGSGQVGMAVITTPAVAPAFRDMPPAPGAEVRESIAGGKYQRAEVVAFTSLASLQLPRQQFHLARTSPTTTTITHTIRIEGNPVAALMLKGHVLRYQFTSPDLGASSWNARLGGIEITPVSTARTIVWEVPLELLASQREQDLVVKLEVPGLPSSGIEVARPPATAPTLTSIAPDPVPGLDGQQTVTLNGSGFVDGTRVTLRTGGQSFPIPAERTTVVNASAISVTVNVSGRPAEWTAEVATPDNRMSNRLAFRVDPCPGGIEVSSHAAPGNRFEEAGLRGYCTWYVAERWLQSGNRTLPSIRSARFWAEDARQNGFQVDPEQPTAGSIMVVAGTAAVPDGHVAYVERIEPGGGQFTVTEMNFGRLGQAQDQRTTCFNRVTRRTLSAKEVRGLIGFIHPEQPSRPAEADALRQSIARTLQDAMQMPPPAQGWAALLSMQATRRYNQYLDVYMLAVNHRHLAGMACLAANQSLAGGDLASARSYLERCRRYLLDSHRLVSAMEDVLQGAVAQAAQVVEAVYVVAREVSKAGWYLSCGPPCYEIADHLFLVTDFAIEASDEGTDAAVRSLLVKLMVKSLLEMDSVGHHIDKHARRYIGQSGLYELLSEQIGSAEYSARLMQLLGPGGAYAAKRITAHTVDQWVRAMQNALAQSTPFVRFESPPGQGAHTATPPPAQAAAPTGDSPTELPRSRDTAEPSARTQAGTKLRVEGGRASLRTNGSVAVTLTYENRTAEPIKVALTLRPGSSTQFESTETQLLDDVGTVYVLRGASGLIFAEPRELDFSRWLTVEPGRPVHVTLFFEALSPKAVTKVPTRFSVASGHIVRDSKETSITSVFIETIPAAR